MTDEHPSRFGYYRIPENGVIAGVCAGIAEYFGVRPIAPRALVVIFGLFAPFFTVIVYALIAWLAPRSPQGLYSSHEDRCFWRHARRAPSAAAKDLQDRFREIDRRLRRAEAHVTKDSYGLAREIDDL